jgi:hypothetical protein
MRKSILMLSIVVLAVAGCDDDKPENKDLSLHVQSEFDGDQIVIEVDGKIVLDQEVTTNPVLGVDLDAMKTFSFARGVHSIKIKVNEADELITTVQLDSDLYIGVNYDRETEQLSIVQSMQRFLYE